MEVRTYPLPFGELVVRFFNQFTWLSVKDRCSRLLMFGAVTSQFMAVLQTHQDDAARSAFGIELRISLSPYANPVWVLEIGNGNAADIVRYGSEDAVSNMIVSLTSVNRDDLIASWKTHQEYLAMNKPSHHQ